MIVGIRKEKNGKFYIDKETYSKYETITLTLEEFENFKKIYPKAEYTFKNSQIAVEKEIVVEQDSNLTPPIKTKTIIEMVDVVLVTKRVITDEELSLSPYNYTKVEIPNEYNDCIGADFNDDYTFSIEKYNKRKERENALLILPDKLKRLEELRKDIVQDVAGLYIEDIEARKEEYRTLLNEVRVLQEKTPRETKEI